MRAAIALTTLLAFAGCSAANAGPSNATAPGDPGASSGGSADGGPDGNDGGAVPPGDGGEPPAPDGGPVTCAASTPFGPAHPVADLPEADAFQLAFSPDERTVYYTVPSKVGNAFDIHSASRSTVTSSYGAPTVIAASGSSEKRASVTADGLTLFFYATGITRSTRASTTAAFSAPVSAFPFGEAPFVARDGSVVYFENAFNMPDGSHREIRVTNPAKGASAAPVPVTQLAAAPGTWDAPSHYSADGCRLYFDRLLPPVTTDQGVPYVAVRGGT